MIKPMKLIVAAIFLGFGLIVIDSHAITMSVGPKVSNALIDYVLPRFTLKTSIRFERVESDGLLHWQAGADSGEVRVFTLENGSVVSLRIAGAVANRADVLRFTEWLISDPGRSAVADFRIEGQQIAFPVDLDQAPEVEVEIVGDQIRGRELSLRHCSRCHKVVRANKYSGLDNSPSFHAMRSFEDWLIRFSSFYAVSPHKALISVDGSGILKNRNLIPIAPIDLEIGDIKDIVAFVHSLTPLDLGNPIQLNP